jgi:hypothetical protein
VAVNIEAGIESDTSIPLTDREAIVRARRGQGLFKDRVMEIERGCRITGVTNPVHLIASHCKPWRDSDNSERLNGENGLLLTPSTRRRLPARIRSSGAQSQMPDEPHARVWPMPSKQVYDNRV